MAAPDPVDIRLLSLVAELGKVAVHEIGARLGMDPREVAARLVALSGSGLPLIVGVECDPNGLRQALAAMNYAAQQAAGQPGANSGAYAVPSGPFQAPYPQSGGFTAQGTPSGPYQTPGSQSGGYSVGGTPSGPYQAGQYPPPQRGVQGTPSGRYPGPAAYPQRPPAPVRTGPPSNPFPAAGDPITTWGPPQSASWARGDQPKPATPAGRQGKVGDTLQTEGLDGEQIAIQLVEVVDPADFLFTAAGYRLREGERAVVVHTELTNRGGIPFPTLPDLYLVLVDADGKAVSKAPVSLSSRPPHRIGVQPGETAGGHTVYVLPDHTQITSVRWGARSDDEKHMLTWTIEP